MLQVHRDEPGVSGRRSWETGRGEGDTESLRAVVPEGDVLRSRCGTRGQEETEGPEDPVAALSGALKKVGTGEGKVCAVSSPPSTACRFGDEQCRGCFCVRSEMWL